jgi:hypothetical protein
MWTVTPWSPTITSAGGMNAAAPAASPAMKRLMSRSHGAKGSISVMRSLLWEGSGERQCR